MSTQIPAQWAAQGIAIPTVCARHGLPEVRRARITIGQRTPSWMYVLLLFGVVVFFIARAVGTTSITAAQWPLCAKCVTQRRAAIVGGCLAAVAGLGAWVVAFVLDRPVLVVAGLVLLVAAVALPWLTWSRQSGARLADHTAWVNVPNAHREFAAQFESLRKATVAVEAAPAALAPPAPLAKKLSGWWYVLLIGGIVAAIYGAIGFFGEPVCGTAAMVPGDVCVGENGVEMFTYESEKAGARMGLFWAIAGVVVALGAGLRIRQWNRALRSAWAARNQGQPTQQSGVA